ncbi:molybdopterin-guanine dinucleotide biosynthesis protein B [Dehalococcoidia bacterium]|nr:molybdopterin-guanine dinucleotide biosynthesis protein B [Dehalococcoidia bacterium]
MEVLIAQLKKRGHIVAAIKHCPHGHQVDRRGKDSQRMQTAGADTVLMSSPDMVTVIRNVAEEPDLVELIKILDSNYDIVLVEGYKTSPAFKIVVSLEGEDAPDDADLSSVLANVRPVVEGDGIPYFPTELVTWLVSSIESNFIPAKTLLGDIS